MSQRDEHEWSDLYVSPAHFAKRLALLQKAKANVLPLEDALTHLFNGTLPPRAVAITFDDGCCDFASQAAPLLDDAGFHSTLYLCTYYCRKQLPVFDPIISYILWKGRGRTVALPGVNSIVTIPSALRTPEFESMHRQLLNFAAAAHYDADQKQAYARAIAETLEVDFDAICTQRILHNLNPDEVRALDPNRVSVQLHTHRHRTPSTLEDVQEELTRNGAEIHSMTGRHDRLKHFCYPSGRYSPEFVDWLNTHGVASATTCEPGLATRATERLAIPRFIDTMGVSTDTFMAWVSGTAAFTQFGRATDGAAPEGGAADDPRAATAHVPSSHIFTTPPTTAPASVSKSQTRA